MGYSRQGIAIIVNQHAKLTRILGKTALKTDHPKLLPAAVSD
jgi:hypothetical protein